MQFLVVFLDRDAFLHLPSQVKQSMSSLSAIARKFQMWISERNRNLIMSVYKLNWFLQTLKKPFIFPRMLFLFVGNPFWQVNVKWLSEQYIQCNQLAFPMAVISILLVVIVTKFTKASLSLITFHIIQPSLVLGACGLFSDPDLSSIGECASGTLFYISKPISVFTFGILISWRCGHWVMSSVIWMRLFYTDSLCNATRFSKDRLHPCQPDKA